MNQKLLLCPLWTIISVSCLDMNKIDMIVSFVTFEDRPSSLLIPHLCWDNYEKTVLAKAICQGGRTITASLQSNASEQFLHHKIILVDMSCPSTEQFMMKADKQPHSLFRGPLHWLILDFEDKLSNSDIFHKVDIFIDSDVLIGRKVDELQYSFTEVYKFGKDTELIHVLRSVWRPSSKSDINETSIIEYHPKKDNTAASKVTIKRSRFGVVEDYRLFNAPYWRRRDCRRYPMTMGNVIIDSNETQKHMVDRKNLNQDSITKMAWMVVRTSFQMLNVTEQQIFLNTWGYQDEHGNWQGLIDRLLKKEVDLGTLTLFTSERSKYIDYIAMIGSTAVRFVFRDPPLPYVANIFTLPFSGGVWLAILICVLACAVVMLVTAKWEATRGLQPMQLDGTWADVLILIIGAVLQQGCTLEPRYAAGRIIMLVLFISLTILFSAYCAYIVVLLQSPSSSVRTLKDLLESPIKVGASDFDYNRYFFKKLNEPIRKAIYDKKIAPKGKRPNFFSMEEGVEKIRKGLFAFHMETNPGYRMIQETYQEVEKCDLVEMDYMNVIGPWLPGQKRGPFKDFYRVNFCKIWEVGIQQCIHKQINVPRPRCQGSVAAFSSVGIIDMYPCLVGTAYGMLMSVAVLFLEIAYHRLTKVRKANKLRRLEESFTRD